MSAHSIDVRIFRGTDCIAHKTLSAEVIKVGRLKSCHICLDDPAISRMHSVIELSREGARWIDLDGHKPTAKNGQNFEKNTALSQGDTLQIGPYRIEIMNVQLQPRTPVSMPAVTAQAAPVRKAPARSPVVIDPSEVEVQDGSRVAEVVAMYGNTVLDVQHLGQTQSKRRTAPAWMLAGGALAIAGAALFGYEATQDWSGYQASVTEAREMGTATPQKPGTGLGGLGLALAFCGLVPFGVGMVRMGDQARKDYTLGEAHDASFHIPTTGLPNGENFPLVRELDGEYTLQFTNQMRGEVTVGGHEMALEDLIQSGRAQAQGAFYSFPLASGANCRVQHGNLTFFVNSVAPGAKVATRQEVDRPFWLFNGGSLAVLGSLLMVSQLIPADANAYAFEEDEDIQRFVGYMTQADMQPEPEEELLEDSEVEEEAGGSGQRASGAEGQMGDKKSQAKNRRYAIAGNAAIPKLGRNQSVADAARTAGILGLMKEDSTSFFAAADGGMYTEGQDDADVFGGITGTEVGTAYGVGGLGLVGTGRGGGGEGHGTIGLSNVGTIGHGKGGGPGAGIGRGAGFSNRGRRPPPKPRIGKSTIKGALDKDVIRRVVRAHINEVRNCYNQGLARDPNLQGRVAIQFQIGGSGKVPMAVVQKSSVKDERVGNCIAKSVRRWKFPRPRDGGMVLVTYPFLLNAR